jgi:ADP-ribosylglycohydrolase
MKKKDYARKSLAGLWVGDCIGNLGQLYFIGDILKALDAGIAKFGGQLDKFQKQFQLSDDTEEGIVLYNHLIKNGGKIHQDQLAMEFATRYMERDPDGEIYGYGLNTRKVLRDIYEGVPWKEANKIIPKSEGMPSHIDSLVDSLSQGKDYKEAMHEVNAILLKQVKERASTQRSKQGSCGNGSAMRVAPLGAYFGGHCSPDFPFCLTSPQTLVEVATLSAEPTHDHPEGIAGAVATALASYFLCSTDKFEALVDYWPGDAEGLTKDDIGKAYLDHIIQYTPDSDVKKGLEKAKAIVYTTPIGKVIEILGNGTHVTCQDTVPFCCYMVAKALCRFPKEERYEKAIIETSMGFGDVDTNCAIVGGILGVINPPPDKWVKFCQPMDGVL